MSSSTPGSIQPGWYDDPQAPGMLRWFDGTTWTPRTRPNLTKATKAPGPHAPAASAQAPAPKPAPVAARPTAPATPPPTGPDAAPSVWAARATWLAADSGPIPVVPTPAPAVAATPAPTPARVVPTPVIPPAPVVSTPAARPAAVVPTPALPSGPLASTHASRPAPAATQSVAAARAAARPAGRPAQPVAAAAATATASTPAATQAPAPAWPGAAAATAVVWPSAPSAAAVPTQAPPPAQSGSLWLPAVEAPEPKPKAARRPTKLRQLVGRLAEDMPAWLPPSIADSLSLRMVRYATSTSRFRDHLSAANLKRLVFPAESAWQASTAACLGVAAIALSVWPLVGLGMWLVASAFAGMAFLRLRREVLLGGMERAWFGIACGVGPLFTGMLALAFR